MRQPLLQKTDQSMLSYKPPKNLLLSQVLTYFTYKLLFLSQGI